MIKTIILSLFLAFSTFAQCTSQGVVVWDVQPWLTQICGRSGDPPTQVTFLMQGFVGVAWLSAPEIRFDGRLVWNGYRVYAGKNDSAGKGYRMLFIENER